MSEHWKPGLAVMNANASFSSKPQEEQHSIIEQTLARALNDERLEDIAQDFGIPRSTLNYNLIKHASDDWRDVQAARALTGVQEAENELNAACDGLALARGREKLKAHQWTLEKLLRRLYGDDKAAISINAAGNVSIAVVSYDSGKNDAIDADNAHTIEHDPGPADRQE